MTIGTVFTLLGYVVGGIVLYWAAQRRKMATEGFGYIAVAALCGGILGAKLMTWIALQWPSFASAPFVMFNPHLGGRSIMGGVLGGWVAVELAKHRLGIRRSTGDLFALALPAGEAVGRIGCFINGCCYGIPTGAFWGVVQHDALRHPTQLYSALAAVVIFGILFFLRNRMPREGDLFRLYLILWGAGRFLIEFVRENETLYLGLSMFQWIALELVVLFSIVLWISNRRIRLGIRRPVQAN